MGEGVGTSPKESVQFATVAGQVSSHLSRRSALTLSPHPLAAGAL